MPSGFLLFATSVLAATLIALSAIDIRERRLPDWLTLPLTAAGVAVAFATGPEQAPEHVIAALLGFFCFWSIAKLYRRYRGFDGLGLGDAKLLAAAGAWLGPLHLAPVVFLAALVALAAVPVLRLAGREVSLQSTLPFGPFLSLGFFGIWCLEVGGLVQ